MKVAINYSPEAEMLVRQGAIEFDLFKCPPASDTIVAEYASDLVARAEACRPIYTHFPLNTGDGSLAAVDWDAVEETLNKTGTPYLNVHLSARIEDFPTMRADANMQADRDQLIDVFVKDLAIMTERFGPERVILENVVYRGAGGKIMYLCTDPAVISEVVRETKCGLLLDTAHARLTCLMLGWDMKEYVAQLPVARLKELHVTGAQSDGQRLRDSMPMSQEDWDLTEWVTQKISDGHWPDPWVLAFEYGGIGPAFEWRSEAAVISEQLPRLWSLAKTR